MKFASLILEKATSQSFKIQDQFTSLNGSEFLKQVKDLAQEIDQLAGNIALQAPNSIDYLLVESACFYLDRPLVIIPPFFSEEQKNFALKDAGVTSLIYKGESAELLNYSTKNIPNNHRDLPAQTSRVSFTSGSSSQPKGICLSERMLLDTAKSLQESIQLDSTDRFMSFMPYSILLEIMCGFYLALLTDGECHVMKGVDQPQSSIISTYSKILDLQISVTVMMPQTLEAFVKMIWDQQVTVPQSLKFIGVGGAYVNKEVLDEARYLGIPVFEGYGLTEAASVSCLNLPIAHQSGTVGKALPHRQIEILEDGEISISGFFDSSYCDGSAPFLQDGTLLTGDIGKIDNEGFLSITGRKKNIFICSNGRNISPEWLEQELLKNSRISRAFAFGEGLSQPEAIVVYRGSLTPTQLALACNTQLPNYAQLGSIHIVLEDFFQREGFLTANGRYRRSFIEKSFKAQLKKQGTYHDCI